MGDESINNISEILSIEQLAKVKLDFGSPRMREAMLNLGIEENEVERR